MNIPQKHQAELAKVCDRLRQALAASTTKECMTLVNQALGRAERLSKTIAKLPAKLGQIGGRETAKRGSAYFSHLAALRKTRSGGRPKGAKVEKSNKRG